MAEKVLVTGGAGYIGSHTCVELLKAGYEVTVIDNLSNSSAESLKRVQEIAGKSLNFQEGDITDEDFLHTIFKEESFSSVVHFAALKAVGESVTKPLEYYKNNVLGTAQLLTAMRTAGVFNFIFSSSATVYGSASEPPFSEESPREATNPYGRTKLMIEQMCEDLAHADNRWKIALLRYFNPVGAHPSGRIGEDPLGIPNNLFPYLLQVATGRLEKLSIYGNDYPTTDGTCLRDYVHVVDLAEGHVKAVQHIKDISGARPINLGTGQPYSVKQVVDTAQEVIGKDIPHQYVGRRPGDVTASFAQVERAKSALTWTAKKGLKEMIEDSWRWQSSNPQGYHTK